MNDLFIELTRPFPSKYIHDDGRGNSYVPHHVVEQRLIHIFGQAPKTEIVREIYDGEQLSGVVMRMTVPVGDDFFGRDLVVEECGEADNPQAKTNGAKAKSAASDAYKRCAMRLGLGLHLWAGDDYFLFDRLQAERGTDADQTANEAQGPIAPRPNEDSGIPGVQEPPPLDEEPQENGEVEAGGAPLGEVTAPPASLPPNLRLKVNRTRFKDLCRKMKPKVDADQACIDHTGKPLSEVTEEELDELLSALTGVMPSA